MSSSERECRTCTGVSDLSLLCLSCPGLAGLLDWFGYPSIGALSTTCVTRVLTLSFPFALCSLEALSSFDFRLVQLEGTFDHSRIIFLGPRVREGVNGFHVVVPFARSEGGGEVLVNRGFVAKNQTVGEGAQRRLKDGANVAVSAMLPLARSGGRFLY